MKPCWWAPFRKRNWACGILSGPMASSIWMPKSAEWEVGPQSGATATLCPTQNYQGETITLFGSMLTASWTREQSAKSLIVAQLPLQPRGRDRVSTGHCRGATETPSGAFCCSVLQTWRGHGGHLPSVPLTSTAGESQHLSLPPASYSKPQHLTCFIEQSLITRSCHL